MLPCLIIIQEQLLSQESFYPKLLLKQLFNQELALQKFIENSTVNKNVSKYFQKAATLKKFLYLNLIQLSKATAKISDHTILIQIYLSTRFGQTQSNQN